jgi:hypothetical protein
MSHRAWSGLVVRSRARLNNDMVDVLCRFVVGVVGVSGWYYRRARRHVRREGESFSTRFGSACVSGTPEFVRW